MSQFIDEDNGVALYNTDCVELTKTLPDGSIDFSVYSPPFSELFVYSDNIRDMGNALNHDEFMKQYEFLISELYRATRPGRLTAIHCIDLPLFKGKDGVSGLRDWQGEIIKLHEKHGWTFHSRVTIWKDPVVEMQRTKANGLLYKQLCADSCKTRQGIADYMVIMRKTAESTDEGYEKINADGDKFYDYSGASMVDEPYGYKNEDERKRFYSINVWQRYASPVWFDIRQSHTLNTKVAKEDKDNKHICPLQLDVISRCIELWSNPGELVFSPFTGIGSEGYQAVKMGRKFIGSELKEAYFNVACKNIKDAIVESKSLFDGE